MFAKVYEGLTYKLRLEFPPTYPYTAPVVRFTTPCFHPNVDNHGNICLDILKEKWSALYDVRTILISIQSLLGGKIVKFFRFRNRLLQSIHWLFVYFFVFIEPNNDSPLNQHAATLWSNQKEFKKHLQELNLQQPSSVII